MCKVAVAFEQSQIQHEWSALDACAGYYGRPFEARNKVCLRAALACNKILQARLAYHGMPLGPWQDIEDAMTCACDGHLHAQAKGGSFAADKDFYRFTLGRGEVIPAVEEAVTSMKEGGIRRIVVPVELGYPNNDMNALGPSPSTFSVRPTPLSLFPLSTQSVPLAEFDAHCGTAKLGLSRLAFSVSALP